MNIYIIKDLLKGKEIFSPIALDNDEMAIRVSADIIQQNPIVRNNPEQFQLIRLCSYSEIECLVTDSGNEIICNFVEIIKMMKVKNEETNSN